MCSSITFFYLSMKNILRHAKSTCHWSYICSSGICDTSTRSRWILFLPILPFNFDEISTDNLLVNLFIVLTKQQNSLLAWRIMPLFNLPFTLLSKVLEKYLSLTFSNFFSYNLKRTWTCNKRKQKKWIDKWMNKWRPNNE